MILQPALELTTPKENVAKLTNYQHPLNNFRELAIAYDLIGANDDMGVLRTACLSSGLSKADWRFLNRYGENAYAAVIPTTDDDLQLLETILFYINWQCSSGLKEPLADELGERFISCMYDAYILERKIDPRIAKVADDHWNKLADPAERKTFAIDEWVHVLIWMRDEQPRFDRNQWRAGWEAIRRRYQKWKTLNKSRIAWHSILPSFDQDGLRVQPLTSSYDLAQEGGRMKNCVGTYTKQCISGNYRLFSISEKSSERPLATASILKEGEYWKIDQIKGKFNRTPETRAARLGRVILKKYTDQEELIAKRKRLEHKRCIETLRAEHEAYLSKRQKVPEAFRGEFSHEESSFLEQNAAWLSALASGELQPNACEQVRFIGVSKGIFTPRTETEKIWKRFQVLCNN
jgi:uncharacterized protein YifE (UPF0438 family)